ncbi:hypothetical protein NKI25_11225 [Mesorhizobium sp. M0808]|uniref:hypothetical protein n=1 Tax=Mesorhizobium sp. M0808 TaxID=2957002 RepID=UPI00333A007F
MNVAITAALSAGALIWSYTSFPVPPGLEFLHLVNAAAVGSGYLCGFESKELKFSAKANILMFILTGTCCLFGSLLYAYLVWRSGPGISVAIGIILSSFILCFCFSAIVGGLAAKDLIATKE